MIALIGGVAAEKNGLGRKMLAREAPGQTAKGQARWSSLLGEGGRRLPD